MYYLDNQLFNNYSPMNLITNMHRKSVIMNICEKTDNDIFQIVHDEHDLFNLDPRSDIFPQIVTEFEKDFLIKIFRSDIQYLTLNCSKLRFDPNDKCVDRYVTAACAVANDPNVVQLLLDFFKININDVFVADVNWNCLQLACNYNPNPCIVKYLIDEFKMDPYQEKLSGCFADNCLVIACERNNYNIVKYFVEEYGMDVNYNYRGFNYLDMSILNCANNDIIAYLIEKCDIEQLSFRYAIATSSVSLVTELANLVTDNNKLNHLLMDLIDNYSYYLNNNTINTIKFLKTFNPLKLNEKLRKDIDFKPSDIEFNVWIKLVDEIKSTIIMPFPKSEKSDMEINDPNISSLSETKEYITDQDTRYEQIFEHNGIIYYGNRKVVYQSMLLFQDIVDNMTFDQLIVLSGSQPQYIIDLYIKALHCKKFLIDDIQTDHIKTFINFINQYPTAVLSIDLIEDHLINYFEKNNIEYDQYMKDICMKYKLKYMYVHIHNKSRTITQ
jgi:hypothetical protein